MNNLTAGHQNRWRSLVSLCISLLVISLDNTVVNVLVLPLVYHNFAETRTMLVIVESPDSFAPMQS
jgi:hypothetical protein